MTIDFSEYKITSGSDLNLAVIAGREGIGETYSTRITYANCAKYFDVESLDIPERLRMQREVDKPRVKAIINYLLERSNTFFPSVILIVNKLDFISEHVLGDMVIKQAVLPASADRLFIDGQGRLSSIKQVIDANPDSEMQGRHLDVKIIVVDTPTIRDSAKFVTQLFCDLHLGFRKPNSSQSIYFDSEKPINRIAKDLISSAEDAGIPLSSAISITGKLSGSQVYTLANLADFVSIVIGEGSKQKLNGLLADRDSYSVYLDVMTQYVGMVYKCIPVLNQANINDNATEYKNAISNNVLTCAIGLRALAWIGRSFIENALANNQSPIDFNLLEKINSLPIGDKKDELWIKREIYQLIDGRLTIIKASEKRLASVICHAIRLLPCEGLI